MTFLAVFPSRPCGTVLLARNNLDCPDLVGLSGTDREGDHLAPDERTVRVARGIQGVVPWKSELPAGLVAIPPVQQVHVLIRARDSDQLDEPSRGRIESEKVGDPSPLGPPITQHLHLRQFLALIDRTRPIHRASRRPVHARGACQYGFHDCPTPHAPLYSAHSFLCTRKPAVCVPRTAWEAY